MFRHLSRVCFTLALCGLLALLSCSGEIESQDASPGQSLILISVDGFRWDYPEKTATPNLDLLIQNGVRATRLIPCFPSKTFPNHYTVVTGLYPENHGIIANNMLDRELGSFTLSNRDAIRDPRWWGGEPIWVTAEKQGLTAACCFWPGSETKIQGVLPTHWFSYDHDRPDEERIAQLLEWLDLPGEARPDFLTTYFSFVDDAGHRYGPNSEQVDAAIQEIDRLIGLLVQGIRERELSDEVNLIVLADHGMAEISIERTIFLDDYLDLSTVKVADWNPVAYIFPAEGQENETYAKLHQAHPHLQVYWRDEIPTRYRYSKNSRISPILAVADEGWSIISRETFEERPHYVTGGNHGFDNQLESMGAFFVASGPAFKSGLVVEPFQNIHIYELMSEVLGVKPAPNDGDLGAVRHLLR